MGMTEKLPHEAKEGDEFTPDVLNAIEGADSLSNQEEQEKHLDVIEKWLFSKKDVSQAELEAKLRIITDTLWKRTGDNGADAGDANILRNLLIR
jgi:hypothetical protein